MPSWGRTTHWLRERVIARERSKPLTTLETWLQARIVAVEKIARQRPMRGDKWYIDEMGRWDFANIREMHDGENPVAPDLVLSYREDPRTGHTDGIYPPQDVAEYDRYYNQRTAWIRNTFSRLRRGEGPDRKAIDRRRRVAVEAEIALAQEEGTEMAKLLRRSWPHLTPEGSVVETALPDWRDKTAAFLDVALGPACRSGFRDSGRGSTTLEHLEAETAFLGSLGRSLKPEMIETTEDHIRRAIGERRGHDATRFLAYNQSPPLHPSSSL